MTPGNTKHAGFEEVDEFDNSDMRPTLEVNIMQIISSTNLAPVVKQKGATITHNPERMCVYSGSMFGDVMNYISYRETIRQASYTGSMCVVPEIANKEGWS